MKNNIDPNGQKCLESYLNKKVLEPNTNIINVQDIELKSSNLKLTAVLSLIKLFYRTFLTPDMLHG